MKWKQAKGRIGLMLAVMLVVAGCGSTNTTETPSDSIASEAVAQTESSSEAETKKEELEYVKLKGITIGDPGEAADIWLEKTNEMLLRDLNCELEIEYISWSGWRDKYPLVFASGEAFDFIYTANWAYYADQAMKGAFYGLTEEDLQTYMPKTWEAVGDRWNQTKVGGIIYMVPQSESGLTDDNTCFGVRGDLMKEAGLEDITSPEDMEVYLDYVVANHPELNVVNITSQGNGLWGVYMAQNMLGNENEYPMVSDEYGVGIANGFSSFVTPYIWDCTDPSELKLVDEETADAYNIKLYSKSTELRKKGYWSSDCLSSTTNIEEYYQAGNGAVVLRQLSNVSGFNNELVKVAPASDPRIVRWVDCPLREIPVTNNGIGIHATTEHPERVMMVLEKLGYDQEYVDLLNYGIEGIHYTLDPEGRVSIIAEPEYNWNAPLSMGLPTICKRETAYEEITNSLEDYMELKEWAKENSITPKLLTFNFDNSPVATEFASVTAVNSQYVPVLSTGMADDVEATYYEWKAALEAAGMDTVVEEYLRQAQEYLNSLQ